MATSVLVTEVPMLVPMMMGMASLTVSTARVQFYSSSPIPHDSKVICFWVVRGSYSQPDETMLTTIEEEVDELWTNSVTRIPITNPATGFDRTVLSWKMLPAVLPGCIQQVVIQFVSLLRSTSSSTLDLSSLTRNKRMTA